MKIYCLALDLIDDPTLIQEYIKYHENVWPEVLMKIKESGIQNCEIYRFANRLFMRLQTNDDFTFEYKSKLDSESEIVQEWESLMWTYQQAMPGAKPGEKWMIMEKIFDLNDAVYSG